MAYLPAFYPLTGQRYSASLPNLLHKKGVPSGIVNASEVTIIDDLLS